MNKLLVLSSNNITPESVMKFSYFVGIICFFMILINLWFIKELIFKIKETEERIKILYLIFGIITIIGISIVILFLAINCFII